MLTEKYVSEHMWSILNRRLTDRPQDEIKRQVEELMKFLVIRSEGKSSFIPLSQDVDDVWHEFILQTKSYRSLCDSLPGKVFIDHESLGMEEYVKRHGQEALVEEMLSWLPEYVQRFGDFDEDIAGYWTACRFLQTEMGMSLDEINALAREQVTAKAS